MTIYDEPAFANEDNNGLTKLEYFVGILTSAMPGAENKWLISRAKEILKELENERRT